MMATSDLLFYGGIALMGIAVAAAVAACIIFSISGKRLKAQLEKEFGNRRH